MPTINKLPTNYVNAYVGQPVHLKVVKTKFKIGMLQPATFCMLAD
jgi:hypothetical protein